MTPQRFRRVSKVFVATVLAVCFLTVAFGAATHAAAADPPAPSTPPAGSEWETWPPKKPGEVTAGEAAGAKTSAGISAGTWYWILGGVAAAILIGVAASGGGGSSSTPNH